MNFTTFYETVQRFLIFSHHEFGGLAHRFGKSFHQIMVKAAF